MSIAVVIFSRRSVHNSQEAVKTKFSFFWEPGRRVLLWSMESRRHFKHDVAALFRESVQKRKVKLMLC
jgi:hypothetical protein